MNHNRLLSRLEETSEAVERLREELNQIENRKDDFAVFLFQARREYSYSIEHSTKSGKGITDTQRRTFEEAVRHGFKGTRQNWLHLLDIPTRKPG